MPKQVPGVSSGSGRLSPIHRQTIVSTTTTSSSGSVTLTPETGYLFISPVGFLTRAEEFLEASVLLSQKSGRFSFVAVHLSCSGIELGLKAFLLAKGGPETRVRKHGHDFHTALVDSFVRGIDEVVTLSPAERDLLLRISKTTRIESSCISISNRQSFGLETPG
jgi:hypothetical protein